MEHMVYQLLLQQKIFLKSINISNWQLVYTIVKSLKAAFERFELKDLGLIRGQRECFQVLVFNFGKMNIVKEETMPVMFSWIQNSSE